MVGSMSHVQRQLGAELKAIVKLEGVMAAKKAILAVKRAKVKVLKGMLESAARREIKEKEKKEKEEKKEKKEKSSKSSPKTSESKYIKRPDGVCHACFYRSQGKAGGPKHSFRKGECKYRCRGVVW